MNKVSDRFDDPKQRTSLWSHALLSGLVLLGLWHVGSCLSRTRSFQARQEPELAIHVALDSMVWLKNLIRTAVVSERLYVGLL